MREPVSGHEVVKKKRDCNNLEKETLKYILKYKSSKSVKYEDHCKSLEEIGRAHV